MFSSKEPELLILRLVSPLNKLAFSIFTGCCSGRRLCKLSLGFIPPWLLIVLFFSPGQVNHLSQCTNLLILLFAWNGQLVVSTSNPVEHLLLLIGVLKLPESQSLEDKKQTIRQWVITCHHQECHSCFHSMAHRLTFYGCMALLALPVVPVLKLMCNSSIPRGK